MFPFISDEGILYFASNGHFGLGGLDVYMVTKSGGSWGKIANVGAPISSMILLMLKMKLALKVILLQTEQVELEMTIFISSLRKEENYVAK